MNKNVLSSALSASLLFFIALILGNACQQGGHTKLAVDRGTSSEPTQPSPAQPSKASLTHFAVFYGWPNSLNSSELGWNNISVANFFKQYDLVVFGAGLEDTAHGDHVNMITIAAEMKGSTEVFGYVAMGITDSFSVAAIKQKIDDWKNRVGVDGIFIDEAGFDFKLAGATDADCRARQIELIDYIHASGMKVFVNGWDPDDLFVKEASNPITWLAGDKYLLESYVFSTGGPYNFSDYRARIAKVKAAANTTGVEMLGISTTNQEHNDFIQGDFDYLVLSAIADGLDGISWGSKSFSSTDSVMPFRSNASLFEEYTVDPSPVIDQAAQTIRFKHESGTVLLNHQTTSYLIE